jgi:hypothetical protein
MKIKKNTFSTLVLELFFLSIANCKKLKIQKSTSPAVHVQWQVVDLNFGGKLCSDTAVCHNRNNLLAICSQI